MADRERIRHLIDRYIAGINDGDVASIPLTADARFEGAMLPEPRVGEAAVRDHLAEIAPFVDMTLEELVVEGDRAVAVMTLRTVAGQTLTGAGLFHFRDGRICSHRGFTDTHRLFTGQR